MTWTLVHTIERQSSSSTKIVREWSDSDIEMAAQKMKMIDENIKIATKNWDTYDELKQTLREFLPDQIKEAL